MKRVVLAVCAAVFAAVSGRADTYTWTGGTGTWDDSAHWLVGGAAATRAPGEGDTAIIPAPASGDVVVTANEPIKVLALSIGAQSAGQAGTVKLTIAALGAVNEISDSLFVRARGTITGTANSSATGSTADSQLYKLVFTVGGNLEVDADGEITVKGQGYPQSKGIVVPSGNFGGHHGGQSGGPTSTQHCYGSIRHPVTLGSGGSWTDACGGGAMRLAVTGSVTINGTLDADGADAGYYTGAGGSIWLTAASLTGSGTIHADGGTAGALGYNGATSGGGGRVAVHLTRAGADFAAFAENGIHAYGGWVTSGYSSSTQRAGACGTVYLKEGSQPEAGGTLVVDNGGYEPKNWNSKSAHMTEIAAGISGTKMDVTDTEVGSVVIKGKAKFRVCGTATLTVNGSWTNESVFEQTGSSVVRFAGSAPATIAGKSTFTDLRCEVPGKELVFGTGAANETSIAANGLLTLKGAAGNLLSLRGATADEQWLLSLGAGTVCDNIYLDVAWSDASKGSSVGTLDSIGADDSAHNVNWQFARAPVPGEENRWLGGSSDWNSPANWSCNRLPVDSDYVNVPAGTTATLPEAKSFCRLSVGAGATLNLNGFDLTVTNGIDAAGRFVATGRETIRAGGNVTLSGTSDLARSTFVLTGAQDQSVTTGGQTFYSLRVEKDAGAVAWTDSIAVTWAMRCVLGATAACSFAAGSTVSCAAFCATGGALTGAGGWTLATKGLAIAKRTNLSKCTVTGGSAITDAPGTDCEGWTVGEASIFEDPDAVALPTDASVAAMWLDGSAGEVTVTADGTLTVAGGVLVGPGAKLVLDDAASCGLLCVLNGGTLTGKSNAGKTGTTPDAQLQKLVVSASGDLLVEKDGFVTVKGLGYPEGAGISVKSHGGRGGTGGACYGSVRRPVTLGGGGGYNKSEPGFGGGAMRLAVTGAAVIDGELDADGAYDEYYTGAGGSIWLTAESLTGIGKIHADGGYAKYIGFSGQSSGGGGRVAIHLTGAGRDFSGFANPITAYGGYTADRTSPNFHSGNCGTVFLKTGDQAETEGTLVLDNGGSTPSVGDSSKFSTPYTEIGAKVTDAEVGTVIIRNGARVNLCDAAELIVNGSWTNASTFVQSGTSVVRFAGAAPATIAGKTTFTDLRCEAPGKVLSFATGTANGVTIADGGTCTFAGEAEHPLVLVPSVANETWAFTLTAPDASATVQYVAVSNSDAHAGLTVATAYCQDKGGNLNWSFAHAAEDGDPLVWTGGDNSTDWNAKDNWLDRYGDPRSPKPGDVITIPSGKSVYPRITAGSIVQNELIVEAGASFTLAGGSLLVTNRLQVAGSFVCEGAVPVTCSNEVLFAAGAFTAGQSIFTLTGGGEVAFDPAGNAFHRLEVLKDGGRVTFADGFTAQRFVCRPSAALRLDFASGRTVTAGGLELNGMNGALTLGPSGAGDWKLVATSVQYVTGVTVAKSDASGGVKILADATCVDGTGNANWVFNAPVMRWIGKGSSDFRNAANWWPNGVPGEGSNAVVQTSAAETMSVMISAGEPVTVANLILWAPLGKAQLVSKARLVVKGNADVCEGGELALDRFVEGEPNEIEGNLTVAAGGVVTHSANVSTADNRLNLHVAGDATVAANGCVDVQAKGFSNGGPAQSSGNRSPSHGGRGLAFQSDRKTVACYGSVQYPVTLGSSGLSAGGGAARLVVDGTLTVNGEVNASGGDGGKYYNGAGGSIWLDCGSLAGAGTVRANGGCPHFSQYNLGGGGGRIAVYVAQGGLANWGGSLRAWGGWNTQLYTEKRAGGYAGTVYVQEGAQLGTVTIDNNGGHEVVVNQQTVIGADWPMADDTEQFRKGVRLVIRNGGHVTVLRDANAGDVSLEDGGFLTVTNVTLSIYRHDHKKRRGWTGTVQSANGAIVWKSGMLLLVK